MGADRTPLAEDVLGQWTDAVVALIHVQTEPVVIVGHSRGGLIASTVAERVPDRVRLIVFLCAMMIASPMTVLEYESRLLITLSMFIILGHTGLFSLL